MRDNALISRATYRRYLILWTWCTPRFSEPACQVRYAYRFKHGEEALLERETRLRRRLFGT